ncbi:MAG: nascent polypeptide-associated complex protein [Staphylothermus sp.]|nr:nascent polypeptide-associated complex protein [Staphylothermus sp.]
MFPGMSPRELRRALKRLGIQVNELEDVREVHIVLSDKKIVIEKPQVLEMKSGGQSIFQIIGTPRVEEIEESIEISEEDIEFVMSQTGASKEEAREALIKAKGDLAEAILYLKEKSGR